MFKKLYVGLGGALIGGYLIWSLLGWEFGTRRDPVPRAIPVRYSRGGSSYYYGHGGRSSGGYYRSSSGFGGFGK